jgi:hypothetical protein
MSRPGAAWRALGLSAALAIVHTWPLSAAPWYFSLNYHADAQLNAWILSWIAHALTTAPAHLFDGNIFAPEPATLAYSDPLIIPALLVAPVRWLGGSPVLAFNLATILGLTLTAWSAWFVAWRWTRSTRAALTAGALAAFNVHVITRLAHLAATHAWGLPLAWYFADELIDRPNVRTALWLALVVAATAATSIYLLAFAGVIVAIHGVVALGARRWRGLLSIVTAAAAGLLIAAPVLWPYWRFARMGTTRPIEVVAQFSASTSGYFASTSRVDGRWLHTFYTNDVNVFFAGVCALLLAALGIALTLRRPDVARRRAIALALILCGIILSLGPSTAIYRWLYDWFLPMRGLRAAARFGYLYLLAIAMLAAWGVAALERRYSASRAGKWIAAGAVILVTVEAWSGPVRTTPFTRVPAIYSLFATMSEPVRVVEVPFYPADAVFENAEYVFNSTVHWRPLMNGYSGYTPDSYRRRADVFWFFPEPRALEALRAEGATHLIVHLARFSSDEAASIERVMRERQDFQLLATDPHGNRLYAIR